VSGISPCLSGDYPFDQVTPFPRNPQNSQASFLGRLSLKVHGVSNDTPRIATGGVAPSTFRKTSSDSS
jgi:hypothetical protein